MPTTNQLVRKGRSKKKRQRRRNTRRLAGSPMRAGVVLRAYVVDPKKPNSADRKLCRVRLSNGYEVTAHIPGEAHNIHEHSKVLVRGGRIKDVPGIRYRVVRGVNDAAPVSQRRQGRSRYGAKRLA